MNSTKTLFLAALATGSLLAFSPAATAADTNAPAMTPPAGAPPPGARGGPRGGPMTADTMLTRLQTALGETNKLSDEQVPKVKTAFEDQIKKLTDLRSDTTIAQADRATKRTAIQKETSDALKAILTPAQFTIYESLPRGGNRNRPGGAGGTPPGGAPATPPAAPPQN